MNVETLKTRRLEAEQRYNAMQGEMIAAKGEYNALDKLIKEIEVGNIDPASTIVAEELKEGEENGTK